MTSGRSTVKNVCITAALLIGMANLGAARGQDPADLCDQAAERAAADSLVPAQVLFAITRAETGRHRDGQLRPWPWAINLKGEGYWFPDATEAMAFANEQLSKGIENFDIGCFQINLHWHGAEFASLDQAMDPFANAAYAARFLTELQRTEGSWAEAIAAYHSRSPEKSAGYLQRVESILAGLGNFEPSGDLVYATAKPRENSFPLLQSGEMMGGASLVPRLNRTTPLIGVQ